MNNRAYCSETCMKECCCKFGVRMFAWIWVRRRDGFGIKLSGGPDSCSQQHKAKLATTVYLRYALNTMKGEWKCVLQFGVHSSIMELSLANRAERDVNKVTAYGLPDRCSTTGRDSDFSVCLTVSGVHSASYWWKRKTTFQGIKWPECDADNSPLPKNVWELE